MNLVHCVDPYYDKVDKDGQGCDASWSTKCGAADDEDFKAKEMCCACGGGITRKSSKLIITISNLSITINCIPSSILAKVKIILIFRLSC